MEVWIDMVCVCVSPLRSPQALQRQRGQLERMRLTPPAHIEIVDCYVHKGEVEEAEDYLQPWTHGAHPQSDLP